jgi:hypothetical protein
LGAKNAKILLEMAKILSKLAKILPSYTKNVIFQIRPETQGGGRDDHGLSMNTREL